MEFVNDMISNVNDFSGLVNTRPVSPSIDATAFPGTPSNIFPFLSSTWYAGRASGTCCVSVLYA
jgi:hypothetical protein